MNLRDLPVSTSKTLELQVFTTMSSFLKKSIHLFIVYAHMCKQEYVPWHAWGSEGSSVESVLPIHLYLVLGFELRSSCLQGEHFIEGDGSV